jgi:hypothetical protein
VAFYSAQAGKLPLQEANLTVSDGVQTTVVLFDGVQATVVLFDGVQTTVKYNYVIKCLLLF